MHLSNSGREYIFLLQKFLTEHACFEWKAYGSKSNTVVALCTIVIGQTESHQSNSNITPTQRLVLLMATTLVSSESQITVHVIIIIVVWLIAAAIIFLTLFTRAPSQSPSLLSILALGQQAGQQYFCGANGFISSINLLRPDFAITDRSVLLPNLHSYARILFLQFSMRRSQCFLLCGGLELFRRTANFALLFASGSLFRKSAKNNASHTAFEANQSVCLKVVLPE